MAPPVIKIYDSDTEVAEQLCDYVISRANEAIEERGVFTIGLSGICQDIKSLQVDIFSILVRTLMSTYLILDVPRFLAP